MTNPLNVPGYIPEMDMRLNNTLETALIQNAQEKTYVISWKFNDGSGCTAVIKANTIDEAINSMEVDIDDICITYIYHD